jgi:uncharacterized protein
MHRGRFVWSGKVWCSFASYFERDGMEQIAPRSALQTKNADQLARFRDRAPWWGGDLQTLRNHLIARHEPLPGRSSRLEFQTSDGSGDRLTGGLEAPLAPAASAPLILLIHGLTGCEDSTYMRESARFHLLRGRTVLRLNLRGAGPSKHVAKGYYHAGCASDIEDVLDGLDGERTRNGVFPVGFSLGGNILLNLLGRPVRRHPILGAAVVSAPIEPLEACRRLMAPRNALYHRWLLRRMKMDVLGSAAMTARERQDIEAARSVYEFDDRWVAPRNGFNDAKDYYQRTAGARRVPSVSVPTLILHARNDPWIPVQPYLDLVRTTAPPVEVVVARSGGHVGFHERGHDDTWHDRMIDRFLRKRTSAGSD